MMIDDILTILRMRQGQTAKELAGIMNLRPSTVSSRLLEELRSPYSRLWRRKRFVGFRPNGRDHEWEYSTYHYWETP